MGYVLNLSHKAIVVHLHVMVDAWYIYWEGPPTTNV